VQTFHRPDFVSRRFRQSDVEQFHALVAFRSARDVQRQPHFGQAANASSGCALIVVTEGASDGDFHFPWETGLRRDRLAPYEHILNMQGQGLAHECNGLLFGVCGRHAAGEIGRVGAEVAWPSLDNDSVSHIQF
jgi:hypothetical protein